MVGNVELITVKHLVIALDGDVTALIEQGRERGHTLRRRIKILALGIHGTQSRGEETSKFKGTSWIVVPTMQALSKTPLRRLMSVTRFYDGRPVRFYSILPSYRRSTRPEDERCLMPMQSENLNIFG